MLSEKLICVTLWVQFVIFWVVVLIGGQVSPDVDHLSDHLVSKPRRL